MGAGEKSEEKEKGIISAPSNMDTDAVAAFVASAFRTFLKALQDYTIDSHGDIGSRVREAAMHGVTMLLLRERERPSLPSSDVAAAVAALVQQAMEKIDRTRAVAGNSLLDLLYATPPVPHLPASDALRAIFGATRPELDWLSPSAAYPVAVALLALPDFRLPALMGLVVSVGGLTESLVRHSRAALLGFLSSQPDEELEAFLAASVKVFSCDSDRVIVPLLHTMALLFEHAALDAVLAKREDLSLALITHTKSALASSDVKKIMAAVDVLCGFVQISEQCRKRSLAQLVVMLCHKFPRVRKATAEKMYLALMAVDPFVEQEKMDAALALLTDTVWDGPLEPARAARNAFCGLLDVPQPVAKGGAKANAAPSPAPGAAGAAAATLESYRDLVDRVGF